MLSLAAAFGAPAAWIKTASTAVLDDEDLDDEASGNAEDAVEFARRAPDEAA